MNNSPIIISLPKDRNNMNIEEKAKQYADWVIHAIGRRCTISHDRIANDFTAGYTQAVTDLSAENEKLREALRELIAQIDKCPLDLSSDEKVEEATFLDAIKNEAKQLITK